MLHRNAPPHRNGCAHSVRSRTRRFPCGDHGRDLLSVWIRIGAVLFLTLAPALAQRTWEVGAAAGYGWTNGGKITAMTGSAYARTRSRYAAGIVVAEDSMTACRGSCGTPITTEIPFWKGAARSCMCAARPTRSPTIS